MAGGGGADSGQAANPVAAAAGGWSIWDIVPDLGGIDGKPDLPNVPAAAWTERLETGAKNAVLGQYPGYGSLWTYDGGVQVTRAGQVALGGLAVVFGLLMFGGR